MGCHGSSMQHGNSFIGSGIHTYMLREVKTEGCKRGLNPRPSHHATSHYTVC